MPQTLFGHLGYQDTATPFGDPGVQRTFYDYVNILIGQYREDTDAQSSFLISRTTEEVQETYVLPGNGMMQSRGGLEQSKAIKGISQYTIGFPIAEFGDQFAADRIGVAYMTVQRFDAHLANIFRRDSSRYRYEMFKRFFNPVQEVFPDPQFGNVTVFPIANGDATLYPSGVAGTDLSTANNFIATNFAAITNADNPYSLIVGKLVRQFGNANGGSNVITFINSAQSAATKALADFTEIPDRFINLPDTERTLNNVPNLPGSAVPIGRTNGTWVAEWDSAVPAGYMFGTHLDADPPLVKRVDRAVTRLQRGLHIIAENGANETYPFQQRHYLNRYGFGASNRLNGVALQLVASTTYAVPAQYS